MSPKSSLSYSAAVILQAVANGYQYGFDIMDMTGLPSGTIYPALRRMEALGFVDSNWEPDGLAQEAGRPARKYYVISKPGIDALNEAVKRYRFIGRLLPRSSSRSNPSSEKG